MSAARLYQVLYTISSDRHEYCRDCALHLGDFLEWPAASMAADSPHMSGPRDPP